MWSLLARGGANRLTLLGIVAALIALLYLIGGVVLALGWLWGLVF